MRSDRGSSVGRNGTQRTDSTVNARVPILIGACLPAKCDFFALLLVASVLQAASWIPSAIHAIAARSRQIILAGLAGRLANNLHAVAIITKYRADERLPLLRREALEAGRHDSQARTARFDGCGLERGELR